MRYVFTRTLPLRSQPEFFEESLVKCAIVEIESATERLVEKHLSRIVDDRAIVHLHMAALAVATHFTLTVRIRDENRVMNIMRGGFGAGADVQADSKLPGHWIGKAALMFAPNRMAAVRKMTQNTQSDFGAGFDVIRNDGDADIARAELQGSNSAGSNHQMIVNRCFYADFCRAEGVPEVTRIFCALDRALFSHISPRVHGIEFRMSNSTLADGVDSPCEFGFHQGVK
jgi:L-2-amino-thiazoline-4-carboxylic acid hydrolase